MNHKLIRLLNSLTNTPHLIEAHALDRIVSLIEDRNNGVYELAIMGSDMKENRTPQYNEDTGVGIISIDGPLTYISYSGMCGEEGCSYQQVQEDFDTLLSLGATTIVLDCDSPGGEAYGTFETGQYLRSQADANGINLIGYSDGCSASAGYALLSSAHVVVTNPYSELGSLGVVVQLTNVNKALQNAGIERSYVFAGTNKVPFDAEGAFTEEFIADLQSKVDNLYNDFMGYVSAMRDIPEKTVRGTEAKMFTAQEAVSLGLADSIMSREEFANYLSDVVQMKSPRDNPMLKKLLNKNKTGAELSASTEENEDMKLEDLQSALLALTTELADIKTSNSALLATKDVELTSLQTLLKDATEKLEKAEAVVAQAEATKQEQKLTARKEALAKVLNAEKAEKAFVVLANVDDAVFELTLSGYQAAANAEKGSDAFKELGVGGQGEEQDGVSALEKLATKKYKK